jgi:hypothetical protein
MSVEILSNPTTINEREKKMRQDVDEFKLLVTEKFDGQELHKIKEALNLMLEVHLPQKDRSNGDPYAKHPLEVAKKVLEMGDNVTTDLIISALFHDSVEDMPEVLFAKRANRKFPGRNHELKISEEIKRKYLTILRDWSFKELEDRYGKKVANYLRHLTHDFDSLSEDLSSLSDEEKSYFQKPSLYLLYRRSGFAFLFIVCYSFSRIFCAESFF